MQVLVAGSGRGYIDGDSLDHRSPIAFTVDGVMTADECAAMIARIDALGTEAAPISTGAGFVMRPDVRNNTRVIIDDPALAQLLFDRVASRLPSPLCDLTPVGANERFRCYRYAPGQKFSPHYDGAFVRDDSECSLLTFMVYLNEGFEGGNTAFLDFDASAMPKTGRALLFQHQVLHEGCQVLTGTKYVLRSDVMYRRAR
jgi:prolyl 4-hydroxylase